MTFALDDVLDVRRLSRAAFAARAGPVPAVRRRLLRAAPGRDPGAGRRNRLRQERDQPGDDAPHAAGRRFARSRAQVLLRRPDGTVQELLGLPDRRCGRCVAAAIAMIFQEPMTRSTRCTRSAPRSPRPCASIPARAAGRRWTALRNCSTWSASPMRGAGLRATRTSSRAACASA